MLHKMKLKSQEFYNIEYNNKIIEVRLNDEKRRKIKVKDKIIFYKLPDLKENICVKVEKVYTFQTFKQLYGTFKPNYFGYKEQNVDDMLKKIYCIYSPEQEKKNGVMAIKFKVEFVKKFP